MQASEAFWQLDRLSNQHLLERLARTLRSQRCSLAELVAQLGEIEERRLHLEAACGSLFSYCVRRLGMSEDEACRRIELARLARKFPALFPELASGRISLSVALVLKPVLTAGNHFELIAAACGATLERAHELVASYCPRPDAPSKIRKLPGPREAAGPPAPEKPAEPNPTPATSPASPGSAQTPGATARELELRLAAPTAHPLELQSRPPAATTHPLELRPPAPPAPPPHAPELHSQTPTPRAPELQPPAAPAPPPRCMQRIEPLSPQRYRIQFTADAELKRKLELARDLLRHAQPDGDFAPIFSRALDLLLDELQRRRFGALKKKGGQARPVNGMPAHEDAGTPSAEVASPPTPPPPAPSSSLPDAPPPSQPELTPPPATAPPTTASSPARSRVGRATRRAVVARDGLGCNWTDADGTHCGSTAWLELDHREPAALGGSSQSENVRLLCRAHNAWAAERAYGRTHIEQAIAARRQHAAQPASSAEVVRSPDSQCAVPP